LHERFVIQEHKKDGDIHWDLMLETEGVLRTYRLDCPPERLSDKTAGAVKIFDHPLRFLTYEGSVNRGKGTVKIVESGRYKTSLTDPEKLEFSMQVVALVKPLEEEKSP